MNKKGNRIYNEWYKELWWEIVELFQFLNEESIKNSRRPKGGM